jgi:hypothetical protein
MINDRIFTTDIPGNSLKAHANGSVSVLLSGRVIVMSAASASKLGGELCHAANAARKLQREANSVKPAAIVAGAVFYFTDSHNRDIQRTVVQVSADRFMFVEPLTFARQSSALDAAAMAQLANDCGFREAR